MQSASNRPPTYSWEKPIQRLMQQLCLIGGLSTEVSEYDTTDLYKIAQQKINTELRQIIHALQINVYKKTVATGRCTHIDAQNDFPDEIYRLALNDMAYAKFRPMSFKKCYFAGKTYIEKYLPQAILENNKTKNDI